MKSLYIRICFKLVNSNSLNKLCFSYYLIIYYIILNIFILYLIQPNTVQSYLPQLTVNLSVIHILGMLYSWLRVTKVICCKIRAVDTGYANKMDRGQEKQPVVLVSVQTKQDLFGRFNIFYLLTL